MAIIKFKQVFATVGVPAFPDQYIYDEEQVKEFCNIVGSVHSYYDQETMTAYFLPFAEFTEQDIDDIKNMQ